MATRAQMRTHLQARLQDVDNAQWSDARLNGYLNSGLQFIQSQVMAIDPMAFVYSDTANIQADVAYYPIPPTCMFEIGVYTRASSTGDWAWLDYIDLPWIQFGGAANHDPNPYAAGYSRWGRYLLLHPKPSRAVTSGLRIEYVPWLVMGADNDVPDVDIGLHDGIVFRAEQIALGDTAQESTKADADLETILKNLPRFYRRRGAPGKLAPMHTLNEFQD